MLVNFLAYPFFLQIKQMIGEKLLNYEIEAQKEGDEVFQTFLAKHTQFDKKVIIKTFTSDFLENTVDKTVILNSLKRLARVQHPHIITFYDYLEKDGNYFLFFEHLETTTLNEHIEKVSGPVSTKKALPWFKQILNALLYAQKHHINQSFINANNIVVIDKKDVKLSDTALTNFYQEYIFTHHQEKVLLFASPERLKEETTTEATEVYQAGCLLYHMLTGRQPYEGFQKDVLSYKIKEEELPPMQSYYPMVEESMEEIVQKATKRNPKERYKNLAEFLEAIEKIDLEKSKKPIVKNVESVENTQTTNSTSFPIAKEAEPRDEKFINIPLFAMILFGVLTVVLYMQQANPRKQVKSEVIFDLTDTRNIQRKQDSISKAKEEKRLKDSLRLVQKRQVKDTTEIFIHKVKPGETLERLSQRYYINIDTLRKMNDMFQVRKNQRLEAKYGLRVRVRDTYSLGEEEDINFVARKFNVSRYVLIQANGIKSEEDDLYEGKVIVIPLIAPIRN